MSRELIIFEVVSTIILVATFRGLKGSKNIDMRRTLPVRYWVWRYFTGYPLDGKRRTNRTFWHRGSRPAVGYVAATWWGYQPGWVILLIRLGILILIPVMAYTAIFYWPWFKGGGGLLIGGVLVYYVARMVSYFQQRAHLREWVRPLHAAISREIGYSPDMDPRMYLHFPPTFREDREGQLVIDLPDGYNKSVVTNLTRIISAKLGVNVVVTVRLMSNTPSLLVKHQPEPPTKVLFSDPKVRALVAGLPENKLFLGLGTQDKPVVAELDTDSPHIAVSARAGGGKSTILRSLICQILSHGGRAILCDVKRVSHLWAKNLHGIIYLRDPGDIHEALIAAAAESDRRYSILEEADSEAELKSMDVGPRTVIVLEEVNTLIKRLQAYWESVREPTDPKRSPAIDALNELLCMGRGCKMHVLAVAQMLTARAIGGPEARENFALRILAKHTPKSWRMLCEHIWPPPPVSSVLGRAQAVLEGVAIETQFLYIEEEDAQELSRLGDELRTRPKLQIVKDTEDTPVMEALEEKEDRRTLQEACEAGWTLGIKYDAARQAKRRESGFPQGRREMNVTLYTREELERWARNRSRAPAKDTGT